MTKKILILNTHSSLNAGDAAIVLAQVKFLRGVFNSVEISLTSRTPELDAKVYASEGVRVIPPVLPAPSVFDGIGRKIAGAARNLADLRAKRDFLKAAREADLVIASGGGYFWSKRRLVPGLMFLQNILHLRLVERMKKPLVLFPQSFGPLASPFHRRLLRKTLEAGSVTKIFAREQRSADFLGGLIADAGTRAKIDVCPDLTFLLAEEVGPAPAPVQVDPLPKPVVALTLRQWDFPEAAGRAERRRFGQEYFGELARFCEYIIRDRKGSVLIYPQSRGPGAFEDDRPVSRAFYAKLRAALPSAPVRYFEDNASTSLEAASTLLSRADLVLATRFHSALLALVRGVPALAIGYQPKTQGIMARLGLDKYAFEISRVKSSDLRAAAEDILASPAAFRERVRPRLVEMKGEVTEKLGRALGLGGAGRQP